MIKNKKITTESKIVKHLEANGQKMKWLADKLGVTSGHLHSVLKGKNSVKRELTDDNLKKINEVLNTEFSR